MHYDILQMEELYFSSSSGSQWWMNLLKDTIFCWKKINFEHFIIMFTNVDYSYCFYRLLTLFFILNNGLWMHLPEFFFFIWHFVADPIPSSLSMLMLFLCRGADCGVQFCLLRCEERLLETMGKTYSDSVLRVLKIFRQVYYLPLCTGAWFWCLL